MTLRLAPHVPAACLLFAIAVLPGLPAPLSAVEPLKLKVFCAARPPASGADEESRKDQAEAPDAVSDITVWLRTKDKSFTLVESREAADLVIEVTARHVPGFGKRWITFELTLGATPLGARKVAAGGTWTSVTSKLAEAFVDWTRKADAPIRAALAARPSPVSDADRDRLLQELGRVGIGPTPAPK